ncbi:hypothetical protein [Brevundimonas sp. AAP58]|uniref:hypothetical protein n=1 Tax=Brevundimonas sp. AAP58 TaxID=1523422 RepID=UPI0006B8D119|nr:hypothetical protein [Brevundimonas sp. AAP58]
MKRRIGAVIAFGLAAAGCGESPSSQQAEGAIETAWVTPPFIQTASVAAGSLTLSGTASPGGRVVVSDPNGQQFAVAADDRGGFRLVMPGPDRPTLYQLEVQSGQARYLAPGRLLVTSSSGGPIAFVSAGAATQRFDPAPPLDAVDADGRALILSGRAEAGASVRIEAGVVRDVTADRTGRWTAAPAGLPGSIRVGGQGFGPALSIDGSDGLSVANGGWRLIWTAPDGARQVTWFPAAVPETPG